jgi:hypothetical protein
MKKILCSLVIFFALEATAQVYNNEWIDFTKTYYKFKVGSDGLRRLPQTTLAAAGLGAVPAEHFQLWRNGKEVPIYTSVATGTLGSSDYIEFWGQMNDGAPDRSLYKDPLHLLNDKWSLETDTAAYFLTVNPSGNNLRLVPVSNNTAGNNLPAELYFMHKVGTYYKNQINSGYAVNVGEYIYSSTYDRGEGWSSPNIGTNGSNTTTLTNLQAYTAGPDAKFVVAVSGNATNARRYRVNLNGDSLLGNQINFLNALRDSTIFPASLLASGSANLVISNITSSPNDRMVVHKYEITYPRRFNFGGVANFEFVLPASGAKYLEIEGFNTGTTAPVLYDLSNGLRYVGDVSTPGKIKILLQATTRDRHLVLVQQGADNITTIGTLQSRTFTDYSLAANQGDYLIISNPLLFTGPGGTNPVDEYRLYRSSANGGGYNAKIYLIEDLVDQFAFGIKKNPLSIRNFLYYARKKFSTAPKQVFLVGKPVVYVAARTAENTPTIETLNLVPTFGNPASDVMLSADPGNSDPKTPIGRLSAINGAEVATYLEKVKQFEAAQRINSPLVADKGWMKNVVHAVGLSEPTALAEVDAYMNEYRRIISDTLFGGKVTSFTKSSANSVEQVNSGELDRLFAEGISVLTYFGHSSANTLEFNLNNPDQYNNTGKYPMFIALGCNAGNFFAANRSETLSERFVLAPQKGSIGFLAGSHFGITYHIDIYSTRLYKNMAGKSYGKTFGEIMTQTISDVFDATTQEEFLVRSTCEELVLNADPAIRLNPHPKPDYVVEEPFIQVTPTFLSVADRSFRLKAKAMNIGKAPNRSITREVKQQYPDGTVAILYKDTIPGIRYADSLQIDVPILPIRDKGTSRITYTIDADGNADELFESNNSVSKDILIIEDGISPVYPYNFSIVTKPDIKLIASTANPLSISKTYRMEIDTTALFNSPLLISQTKTSPGGIIEFSPSLSFTSSTVYYWRVATAVTSGVPVWNTSSFVYMPNQTSGFNQSHFYQHTQSETQTLTLDSSSRRWNFALTANDVFVRHGTWASSTGREEGVSIYIDNERKMSNHCNNGTLIFVVFDPLTFKPWANPTGGLYGSNNNCFTFRQNNFEFYYTSVEGRKKIMDFMQNIIPNGHYVIIRNFTNAGTPPGFFAANWQADTSLYGGNQSLYHSLKGAGFDNIDSFNRIRPWIFMYKKGDPSFAPRAEMGIGTLDNITLSAIMTNPGTKGVITSPGFGPAKAWKELKWNGNSLEANDGDAVTISILGIKSNGTVDTLYRNIGVNQQTVDISAINASIYRHLKLRMQNADALNHTPYQLQNWMLTYTPIPEGAVAPNISFAMKDSFEVGEEIQFKLAFKNISNVAFDSLRVKAIITNRNNVSDTVMIPRQRILASGDTLNIQFPINSRLLSGTNSIFVEVNPDKDQPEHYHFNNYLFKSFYIAGDTLDPVLDVTFDNQHILNGDIVASKPGIAIKLSDNAKFYLLNDTSLVKVKVRYPNGDVRNFHFNSDTLQFIPAQTGVNGNVAMVNFHPSFEEDGTYELMVSAKDMSNNQAGKLDYKVNFQVINKAMISNMLNYPNPFTTSTAFVFTITGAEVPQNIRIQILTVTGKVVREITKEELGTLRVGRNITEFKWNGTDQYGQRLANGVYLYRVITNNNGKSLEKYKSASDNTDKYFNNGYGKMYLMR